MEVPPAVVVDAHDVCSNLEEAQEALKTALGASTAPEAGWRLRVFDERRGTHIIVTANLDDAQGNAVAHRVIDATASDRCDGVISALGVWAGLVLDAEAAKVKAHPKPPPPANTTTTASTSASASTNAAFVPVDSNPDTGVLPPHKSTIEIGGGATLQNSPLTLNSAALVGGQIFALVEIARAFFLRPTLAGAGGLGTDAIYMDGRLDACLRVPGNYVEHRGLLLDLCAGTELAAFNHATAGIGGGPGPATWDAVFAIGPTIGLRGDLASDLSVEVRGVAGFNIVHTGDPALVELLSFRAEVGFTWRLR